MKRTFLKVSVFFIVCVRGQEHQNVVPSSSLAKKRPHQEGKYIRSKPTANDPNKINRDKNCIKPGRNALWYTKCQSLPPERRALTLAVEAGRAEGRLLQIPSWGGVSVFALALTHLPWRQMLRFVTVRYNSSKKEKKKKLLLK